MKTLTVKVATLMAICVLIYLPTFGQTLSTRTSASEEAYVVEGYYKVRWGYAEEFLQLYKKNHYPLLKKALEKGDILKIAMEKPRLHSSEESRWDYKVTLVFKNVQTAIDPNLTEVYKKQLYPDNEKLTKEEQHRFELLIAHWDIAVQSVDLDK